MFQRIDDLVSKHGFYLQSWNIRYSNSVWLGIASVEFHLDRVRDATDDRQYSLEYSDYLNKDWIPIVTGDSFIEALNNMENKLNKIPLEMLRGESSWSDNVYEAFDHIGEVLRENNIQLLSDIKLPVTIEDL